MIQWIKWILKGLMIYCIVVISLAGLSFLCDCHQIREERKEAAVIGEAEQNGEFVEKEEEVSQPDLSDWKNLSDTDLSEALQEQHPEETLSFLKSLSEEEREEILVRETCLTNPFVQYRFECHPKDRAAESVKGGQMLAVADVGKVADLLFPQMEMLYDAELLDTIRFDTYYEYLNLLGEGEDHATLILNNSGYFTVKRDNNGKIDSVMTVYMQTDCLVQELSYERSHITVVSVISSNDKLSLGSFPYVENFYREGGWYYTGIHSVWCNDPPHSIYTGYTTDRVNSCEPTECNTHGHQKYDFYTDYLPI